MVGHLDVWTNAGQDDPHAAYRIVRDVKSTPAFGLVRLLQRSGWRAKLLPAGSPRPEW